MGHKNNKLSNTETQSILVCLLNSYQIKDKSASNTKHTKEKMENRICFYISHTVKITPQLCNYLNKLPNVVLIFSFSVSIH